MAKFNFLSEGWNLPRIEEKVLKFWKENQIFEKSLKNRKGKKTFVFYEGPPTANGRPGIHHVLSRSFKDVILRYRTMRGFFVPRRAGWDTHGLPVEIEVEKALGLKSKKDIEKYGIAEFNQKCRESVWKYQEEWEKLTERMGFWLNMKDPYITYETDYMESLWWILSRFFKKKLLYEGHKVVPWCPRCGTSLSSHELGQPGAYKEVKDNSVYVKFKVVGKPNTFILSWTTTPWTLPGNVALAVGEDIDYSEIKIKSSAETLILSKERLAILDPEGYEILSETKGRELVGLNYEPLFDTPELKSKNSYKIYAADFVTTDEGTGVVHTAVMYGEDDYELGKAVGLPQKHTVDEAGNFTKSVPGFAGLYVKDAETDKKIFEHLEKNGNLLKIEPYLHEYPHCWRCSTPLIYYARDSWFAAVNKVRKNLLKNNQEINWVPEHFKNGRFGEWLKEEKDWNLSRERYWGTPLPIWNCEKCGEKEAIGSLEELAKKGGKSSNTYLLLRHGESEANVLDITSDEVNRYPLTAKGARQVEAAAKKLKKEKIDLIISSDILRAKETAGIISENLGIKIIYDKRLREVKTGGLSGRPASEYHNLFSNDDKFRKAPPSGESLIEVRTRIWDLIKDLEQKYKGKKLLLVGHDHVLGMVIQVVEGLSNKETMEGSQEIKGRTLFLKNAESKKLAMRQLPRNLTGEVDLHRPYVDEATWKCKKCGGEMHRIKEIVDVWFDSGSMPWAQLKYPFQNEELIDKKKFFPADYVSEAVDQTRGWFYVLLAVSTLLGMEAPYKNVISLGLIHDKKGQKMSKSKGNVVDPWQMAEKYGMDAVRWYFYSATPPGEPKNFDENDIQKSLRKFHMLFWNSLQFFETYGVKGAKEDSQNALDLWILGKLSQTTEKMTKDFEKYDVRGAALALEGLTDDLSRWYIRRSRRRFQPERSGGGEQDQKAASATLGKVLHNMAILAAPFTPFLSEAVYNGIGGEKESVHLTDWPKAEKYDEKILIEMEAARKIASDALAKRAEAGIKVRQPLSELKIKNPQIKNPDILEILKEEVNVKDIKFVPGLGEELELNIEITPELKEEGDKRELVRAVQGLRQDAGYKPQDRIELYIETEEGLSDALRKFEAEIKKEVGAEKMEFKKTAKFDAELDAKFEERAIWIGVKKVK